MLEKYPAESTLFDIDCTALLALSEIIQGAPAMTFLPALTGSDALTFGAPVVNTAVANYADGSQAAVGKALQVRISGGRSEDDTTARIYAVQATFSTSAGNTLVAKANLLLLPPGA